MKAGLKKKAEAAMNEVLIMVPGKKKVDLNEAEIKDA